jgi:hypothetical protein
LEDAGFDATVTWGSYEAHELLSTYKFELLMIGDSPEMAARDFLLEVDAFRGYQGCLILKGTAAETSFPQPPSGSAIVCKHNYEEVLRTVNAQLQEVQLHAVIR